MKKQNILIGAAFLMATSAIGPGFLTQTSTFTSALGANFAFVILISILLDIAAQLNIWRIVAIAEKPAQDIANKLQFGLGHLLALVIVFGGLIFNIGNIAGCGLGLKTIFGIDEKYGAMLSCVIAVSIFLVKEANLAMDNFAKFLGILMILMTSYIAFSSHIDYENVIKCTFFPEKIDYKAIVTIVGGTVGGYISFAGAHRLLDGGIKGKDKINEVDKSATMAILLASLMRIVLFLAVLGVISTGFQPDSSNIAASIFKQVAGEVGFKIFGIILWCAAITSVIGAAYTSISFMKTFDSRIEKNQKWMISLFIVFSTFVFVLVGKPTTILIFAGTVNGFILPFALSIMLISLRKNEIFKNYKHPILLEITGWLVVLIMSTLAFNVLK